jgi:hypothetical protein
MGQPLRAGSAIGCYQPTRDRINVESWTHRFIQCAQSQADSFQIEQEAKHLGELGDILSQSVHVLRWQNPRYFCVNILGGYQKV